MFELFEAIPSLFSLQILVPWLLAMVFGVFVGSTPGLTATMAVALIVPFSYQLDKEAALAMVIGVSFTAIFAGDIPATFLRIPGTPASAAATLDAHELAKRGRGRQALLVNLLCSALGGVGGVILLIYISPVLAEVAVGFGAFDYFWLCLLGLILGVSVSSGRRPTLGLLAASLGFAFAMIGRDPLTNQERFTFGFSALEEGVSFIPAMIGLFGMSEVFRAVGKIEAHQPDRITAGPFRLIRSLGLVLRHFTTFLQSLLTGTIVGALPGAGADVAAWGAYGISEKTSPKESDNFGKGEWKGVIAPTSANNAAVAAAWIPALVFGIPGDAVTAIVLGVFLVYDITPGVELFSSGQGSFIFAIALVTQLLLIPAGLLGIQFFSQLVRLPRGMVLTSVVVFSVVGAFAMNNSMVDVWVMFAFGLLGLRLENAKVPLAPLILGMILGPKVEVYLRQGLIAANGDGSAIVASTVSMVMSIMFILTVLLTLSRQLIRKKDEVI